LFGKKSEASSTITPPEDNQDTNPPNEDAQDTGANSGTIIVSAHTGKTRGRRTLDAKSLP